MTEETRVEYGHQLPDGWVAEYRGIKYATHARTVHLTIEEPVGIDHWTYADHRHPVEGCTFCADLAAQGKTAETTAQRIDELLGPEKGQTNAG